jgi:hypothetical protein
MIKLKEMEIGNIDLYGNDVYGLSLILDQIINKKKKNIK